VRCTSSRRFNHSIFAIDAGLVLKRVIDILPQSRRLVTRGPHALVRHPRYLGTIVAIGGVVGTPPQPASGQMQTFQRCTFTLTSWEPGIA
jgi:protein-S-isoprenylcysteine O-methyltransferase Ste14